MYNYYGSSMLGWLLVQLKLGNRYKIHVGKNYISCLSLGSSAKSLFSLCIIIGFIMLTGCADNRPVSTKDFAGNCKVISVKTVDIYQIYPHPTESQQAEIKRLGIKNVKVVSVEELDVDKPEIHYLTVYGEYPVVNNAIDAAQKGQIYYVDIMYFSNNPYEGHVSDFKAIASDKASSNTTKNEFSWPCKKFPCEIPFKILNKGNRTFAWEIQSITCTGQANDRSGYLFTVKGKGAVNSKVISVGSRSITFVPEEKNSTAINTNQAAVYIFPAVDANESFEFNFKGLFPGYYNAKLFAGFLILSN